METDLPLHHCVPMKLGNRRYDIVHGVMDGVSLHKVRLKGEFAMRTRRYRRKVKKRAKRRYGALQVRDDHNRAAYRFKHEIAEVKAKGWVRYGLPEETARNLWDLGDMPPMTDWMVETPYFHHLRSVGLADSYFPKHIWLPPGEEARILFTVKHGFLSRKKRRQK